MTDGYAEERLADFNIALSKAFQRLEKSLGIHNLYNLDKFDEKSKELQKLSKQYKSVYIYGAGKWERLSSFYEVYRDKNRCFYCNRYEGK